MLLDYFYEQATGIDVISVFEMYPKRQFMYSGDENWENFEKPLGPSLSKYNQKPASSKYQEGGRAEETERWKMEIGKSC